MRRVCDSAVGWMKVPIVDRGNFPITGVAATIVTLKPGGLRELHWSPNAKAWRYYVKGTARITTFTEAVSRHRQRSSYMSDR